jgi:Ca2+-transporting ATPase
VDTVDAVRGDGHPPAGGRRGLAPQEAAERLEKYGPNQVIARRPVRLTHRVLSQLRDPLILVLLVAAALTVIAGDHPDAVIIMVVVVTNTAVGVVQDVRADAAVAALGALTAPTARVIRGSAAVEIQARDLVPGDLVELGEGDVVPADAELVEAVAVLVDESALTGESVPAGKGLAARHEDGALRAGTVVVHGRALAEVTATGAASTMGRIATLMNAPPTLTPLQVRMVGLGRRLAVLTVALCLIVGVRGLAAGESLELMVVTTISLVVAAVPESLPAVVTLALALGARRMAARNAIVRRLPAVETLGAITVIATDKTGTLTEGTMLVEAIWTPHGEAVVTGHGYQPVGHVLTDTGPITVTAGAARACASAVTRVLRAASSCCDARLVPDPAGGWRVLGDPTEGALLVAAGKVGLRREDLDAELPRIAEAPFDCARRRMTTVHRSSPRAAGSPGQASLVTVISKGAPDVLLRPPLTAGSPELLAAARSRAAAYAADGYRVLAVAARTGVREATEPVDAEPIDAEPVDAEPDVPALDRDLELLGLVAIADPPRAAAAATLTACRAAGITPVLITGDHVATARAIAVRLGLATDADDIATGAQLAAGLVPDPTRVRVYARTSPEQKLDIVQRWRDAGHVVAMTGDGVNDGPALHRADIGVAMGRRGTEVARQAADLVLADDDLATVVAAVEEGRRVYATVRRFLLYSLSGGVAEIAVMIAGPLLGMPLPLLPAQILWINLITHGMPGVAFGAEPAPPDVMRRPPRPPEQSVLGDGLWQRIARTGALIATLTLAVGVWAMATGRPWQSMVFLTLAATQLAVGLGVRASPGTRANPALPFALLVAFALQVTALYQPGLRDLLGTRQLSAGELVVACSAAVPGFLAARLERRRTDRRHARDLAERTAPQGLASSSSTDERPARDVPPGRRTRTWHPLATLNPHRRVPLVGHRSHRRR